MAISFPYDLLEEFPGWSTEFDLLWRQEQSRTADGRTYVKDLGSPLWRATYQSRPVRRPVLDMWRARLKVLENGLNTFVGRPLHRCYPIAYPKPVFDAQFPTFSGIAAVNSINANRKAISLQTLPVGFKVSAGDMITIGSSGATYNLHQVVEDATANASGITPQFEIRPHLWPQSVVGNMAQIIKPFCVMTLVPDSVSTTAELNGFGSVTFQGVESR